MIDCTGSLFEDTCTFSCDDGYELTGSENRTCQSDQTWSGTEPMCVQGVYCMIVYCCVSNLLLPISSYLSQLKFIYNNVLIAETQCYAAINVLW